MLDVDLQLGAVRGDVPWRLVVPDVELDLGISRTVELDVDGAYAIAGTDDGRFTLDHPAPDNIWLAAKLGLYDSRETGATTAWAMGVQLGPKVPLAPEAHGVGYEALVLVGRTWGASHLVLNLGAIVDPGAQISTQRPAGLEGGVDLDLALGQSAFSLTGELGGVRFFSADPHQLHATAGVTWAANDKLDISAIGLIGLLSGGDQRGILLGISPKFVVW